MDSREKIEACQQKKNSGNSLFKAGDFRRASENYEKAAQYASFDHLFTHEEKVLANSLCSSCYLNNAACKLRLGEYSEAAKLCTKVLEMDPSNGKALYRRSQAYLRVSDLEKAEEDITRALSIHPNDREMKLVYKQLKEKQREYRAYQAEMSRAIVSRMA
ncbi:hypothetical protein SAY87_030074 [Trapa incisa]|uniref:peptidylprolyl isomerase n=1 Tax=Trapa incisa TaxID=236973 RepID=A0AAN7KGC1_9MYRT|nr:hypothetical protein SAY87_030074 [Trapa incisa]